MARINLICLSIVIFAFACLLHTTSASFDLVEYFEERLKQTIEKEHITCENYVEFCEKSTNDLQKDSEASSSDEASKMAIELCKVILQVHVCKNVNIGE